MAPSELIEAAFTAQENISEALDDISSSASITETKASELESELQELGGQGQLTREAFDKLRNSAGELAAVTDEVDDEMKDVSLAMQRLIAGTVETDEGMGQLRRGLSDVSSTAAEADMMLRNLREEVDDLADAGLITDQAADELKRTLNSLGRTGLMSSKGVRTLSNSMTQVNVASDRADDAAEEFADTLAQLGGSAMASVLPQKFLSNAIDKTEEEMHEAGRAAAKLSGELGILSSIAQASSFRFSSLSVNIGPFNLALRNILVQLPAILTGMGTLLAVVTALASAFITLGAALGALVAGGGVAFFEEFSKQFEETGEAVEALMGALKDLFTEALEPLMTDANMDLFIESIEYAARLVNRFAQFFSQMREDIMAFMSGVGADIDILFEALHDSFVMMTPILQDVIQWFILGFPNALMTFSKMTESIADELGMLAEAFGHLFFELLEFADLLINSIGPIIAMVIESLARLFSAINSLADVVTSTVLEWLALTAVFLAVRSRVMGLIGGFGTLTTVMMTQASAGNAVAASYLALRGLIYQLILGNLSLAEAKAVLSFAYQKNLALLKANIASKWKSITAIMSNIAALGAEAAAYLGLSSAIGVATSAAATFWSVATAGILPALAAIIGAITLVVGAIMNFDAIVSAISGTVSFFYDLLKALAKLIVTVIIPQINLIAVPFQIIAAVLDAIIQKIASFADGLLKAIGVSEGLESMGNMFNGILQTIDEANKLAAWLLDKIEALTGLEIGGPALDPAKVRSQIEGESKTQNKNDIQTEPNVDLSFEDKLEQNVDVQADPEDKAQLSRLTKDAIAEANSFARRQQGGQ